MSQEGTPTYNVVKIPGDGIGPEVTDAAVRVLEACDLHIRWDRVEAGAGAAELRPVPVRLVGVVDVLDSQHDRFLDPAAGERDQAAVPGNAVELVEPAEGNPFDIVAREITEVDFP